MAKSKRVDRDYGPKTSARTIEMVEFAVRERAKGSKTITADLIARFGVTKACAHNIVYRSGHSEAEHRRIKRREIAKVRARSAVAARGTLSTGATQSTVEATRKAFGPCNLVKMSLASLSIRLGVSIPQASRIRTLAMARDTDAAIEAFHARVNEFVARRMGYRSHADRMENGPGRGGSVANGAGPTPLFRRGVTPVADPVHRILAAAVPEGMPRHLADDLVSAAWLAVAAGEASVDDAKAAIAIGRRSMNGRDPCAWARSADEDLGDGFTMLSMFEDVHALDAFDEVLERIDAEREWA